MKPLHFRRQPRRGRSLRYPSIIALLCMLACSDTRAPAATPLTNEAAATPASTTTPTAPNATAQHANAVNASTASAQPQKPPPPPLASGGKHAVSGKYGLVSSEDAYATRIGVKVLESGGNAVDAAVAVAYALSVTHHAAGSLGGGGFMLVRLANGEAHAIDYREVAPAAATWALNDKQLRKGAHGYLSAPVPGVVAGLNLARDKFGSKPLKELLAPSIALARDGHKYGARPALVMSWFYKRIKGDPVMRAIFGRGRGRKRPLRQGELLKQPSLAKTLQAIAEHGNDGFYAGPVAEKIARAMKRNGGIVTLKDLAGYRAKVRKPLAFRYRGFEVLTMPPPSMGGIALLSIMGYLEATHASQTKSGSADQLHLFIEAARRSYADRRAIGADPDFVAAQVAPFREALLTTSYYDIRQPRIDATRATSSKEVVPIHRQPPPPRESPDTTHFSVVDARGNAVSCTTTLSAAYGAWVVVPETGVLLSNAMGAFSPSGANKLMPGKRMASSMTPTLLVRAGKTVAAVGSPGGDTIPNTVAQVVRNLIDGHMTIDRAIEAGRIHHQYKPDVVRLEKRRPPSAAVQAELKRRGHTLKLSPLNLGDANGILIDPASGTAYGSADTRKGGLALPAKAPQ